MLKIIQKLVKTKLKPIFFCVCKIVFRKLKSMLLGFIIRYYFTLYMTGDYAVVWMLRHTIATFTSYLLPDKYQ